MNKFGIVKSKLLRKLTESYSKRNKKEVKDLLAILKENKDFKEMYLFYEDMEKKYFDDEKTALQYIEEIKTILKEKNKNISQISSKLNKELKDVEINENKLYDSLDLLIQEDSLNNIDKKIAAKKILIEHLTKQKNEDKKTDIKVVENENLLYAVLSNNFNVLYNDKLNESQKKELKNIISLNEEELDEKTTNLKESVLNQVNTILNESNDFDLTNKLNKVKEEVTQMETSRYNFYRLQQLKNGLI